MGKTIILFASFIFTLFIFLMVVLILITSNDDKTEPPIEIKYHSECDSIHNQLLEYQISNGRYEIIMDRLYEKDSLLYNEITTNIE